MKGGEKGRREEDEEGLLVCRETIAACLSPSSSSVLLPFTCTIMRLPSFFFLLLFLFWKMLD